MAINFDCDIHSLLKLFQLDYVSETEVLEVKAGALCTPRLINVNHFVFFRMWSKLTVVDIILLLKRQ